MTFANSARVTLGIVVAGLAMSLTGCVTGSSVHGIEVTRGVQYQDIPVPIDFDFDTDRSWCFQRFENPPVNLRSFELVYWGNRPLTELREWYVAQMRVHAWRLEDTLDQQSIRLTFTKGSEKAEIVLERRLEPLGHDYLTKVTARVGVI